MFKNTLHISLFVAGALMLASCEKVINVDIKESPNQLVIEGNITDTTGTQIIKLSKSVAYTDSNIYPPVTGAQVTLYDDSGFAYTFGEEQPGLYTYHEFRGRPGRSYRMEVKVDNKLYKAQSSMPEPVTLDSLSITKIRFGNSETRVIAVHFKDPKGIANQYRFIMKVNGKLTKRVYASDDRLRDGNTIKEQLYYSSDEDNEEITSGDEVEIEMQCIDKPVFKYWVTLQDQSQNGPGGGVTPANPPSNIDNNALGYFSAHSKRVRAIKVP
ncbi:MAG: DUF4249 domain-containing protein [Sphingobacteriales bacterium]|nr:MAG: DUF4249 domain-containing protein [Sphingobacteriales bacterium]